MELRNLTGQALSLDGYFISDDEDHPQKFSLSGCTIPENGYLVLAADKKELPFKLSASGDELFLSDSDGKILQRVTLCPLEKDQTYSLQESGQWHVTEPSPMAANNASAPYVEKVFVSAPRFSHEAGFYDEPFDLALDGYKTYKLYYTLDGSIPDENSMLYTGPIHIEDATSHPNVLSMRTDITLGETVNPPTSLIKKATIIRAVAIDPDGNRSSEVTNTYFVGFQNYQEYLDVPILSIVADPYDLFDEEDGIYVLGKTYYNWLNDETRDKEKSISNWKIPANYQLHGKEAEIPVSIQWFDEENALRLTQNVGMRINGNTTRLKLKKSLKLYARKEYGASTIQYDILEGVPTKKRLLVRAQLGEDASLHALLRETGLPVSAYKPCLTFINGEFWGLYEIREKQDEKDIAGYFGLSDDDLLVIKNYELMSGTKPADIKSSSSRAVYNDLLSKISKLDCSTPEGWEAINALIDVDNYTTYMAANVYINNWDCRDNFTIWRTTETGSGEYEDGRWRWIFQDLDRGCAGYKGAPVTISRMLDDTILSALLKNDAFKTNFITRIMDFCNIELTADYVREFITPALTYYNPYIKETYLRYSWTASNLDTLGTEEAKAIVSFFTKRPTTIIPELTEVLGLTCGTSTISLNNLPEGIALEINGHEAHIYGNSWTGEYYKGSKITFAAGDVPGYEFIGWYEGNELISTERAIEISTDADRALVPAYLKIMMSEQEGVSLLVCMNELCSSNSGHYTVGTAAPDYIELRSLTNQPISFDGYYISNDADHLQLFSLDGYTVSESGYIILAADKKELPFKLSATEGAELYLSDKDGNILQRVTLPPLESDTTYSLQETGEWLVTEPSPLAANLDGAPYVEKVFVSSPRFSHAAGFYDEPFDLTLEGYKTYKVYYTTDGSIPDENSTLYTGPIHIEDASSQPNTFSTRADIATWSVVTPTDPVKKATIIRAVAIDPDGNRSAEVTNTYFVGFQNYEAYQNIPILSIVTDPDDMFDADSGIYVLGKAYQDWLNDEKHDPNLAIINRPANFMMRGKEWEIPAVLQWFDADNTLQMSQGAGLRIHGNYSRDHAKKSFNLYARKEYGASTFQYDILEGLSEKKRLVLRGNLGRDSLVHAMLAETGLPTSPYTPCLTFINGEFWGLYEIREKQDERDIADFYGLDADDLLVIKNGVLDAGTQPEEVDIKGTKAVYKYLLAQIGKLDASTPQGYEDICALIDINNYITNIAANTYLNNSDYKANQTIWRTAETGDGEYEDGRWRWIFQDLDNCASTAYRSDRASLLLEDEIFPMLWSSTEFQTKFLTRIMDFANVELTPEYVEAFASPVLSYYEPYLTETNIRFPSKDDRPSYYSGEEQLKILMSFFSGRREIVVQKLTECLQLTCGTSTLTLNNLPDGIAMEINGHEAHIYGNSWTGIYYNGSTVSFTVEDVDGYEFVGWYDGRELLTAEHSIEILVDADRALVPAYRKIVMSETEGIPLLIYINELCSSNSHYTINGATPDYIELRALTNEPIAFDGYYISNDADHLQKFSLDGYTASENGYILLAADKKELPFKLSASEDTELFLSDKDGNILQHVYLPPIDKDKTYSLQETGEWLISEPSPMAENLDGVPYVKKVYVAAPRFSHEAGFYDEPFDLTIEGYKTYRIYYTTDGSVPDENSNLYIAPIRIADATSQPNTLSMRTDILVNDVTPPADQVKKATIIRAVAIDADGNRSNEVINTYFVGFQNYKEYQDIPILSIVADPYDLFDEQDGIYVRGKVYQEWVNDENHDPDLAAQRVPTNYRMRGREWEIPVAVQWFDEDNTLQMSQGAGIRIHGNYSRERSKKSFKLYARKEYGSGAFQFDILEGMPDKEKLIIRGNLGNDSLIHGLLAETDVPVSACTPCLTFINGEFWGLYEIREKQDEKDIASYFGLSPDDLLVIKNTELEAGTAPEGVTGENSDAVYRDLLAKIASLDLSTKQGYEALNELIDVDNYTTFVAAIAYLNNTDYSYWRNFTIWRTAEKGDSEYADARWRWVFQDMDLCCSTGEGDSGEIHNLSEDRIFAAVWQSEEFQKKFLARIMDFANIELTPEYVEEFITPTLTYYDQYLEETYDRFMMKERTVSKPGTKTISTLTSFFKNRRNNVVKELINILGVTTGTSTIKLDELPEGITLEINGHEAHIYGSNWTGVYFKGGSFTVTAGDIPAYEFAGWYDGTELLTTQRTVEISTDTDRTLTPAYTELPAIVVMDETEILYGAGRYGFSKRLKDSFEECTLMPDASVQVEHRYADNSIVFYLDDTVGTPQGFTLSIPVYDYRRVGGVFRLLVTGDSASLDWHVCCRNGDNPYRELEVDCDKFSDGLVRLSFSIPEEQLDNQIIQLRLETVVENGPVSFSLRGFRLYGDPLGSAMALAQEYNRMLKAIDAPAQYYPDLDKMESWSDADIEAEILYLRNRLQYMMADKALTTVGELDSVSPAWEGMEKYPAVVIDEKLIKAFYNEETIIFPESVGEKVYRYLATDDNLILQHIDRNEGDAFSLEKEAGTFFLLDKPVEDIRFSVDYTTDEIPDALISTLFYDVVPQHYLWINIKAYTQYQEEVTLDLPKDWVNKSVYVYRLEGDDLTLYAQSAKMDSTVELIPQEGSYLLLDESLELIAERADWEQKESADLLKSRDADRQQRKKTKKTLLILACAVPVVIIAGTIFSAVRRRKKE